MQVMVTGAGGQLGRELEEALLRQGHSVISCPHQSLDITNLEAVTSAVKEARPHCIINAAAYTNVEKAETDTMKAYLVNAVGASNVAMACSIYDVPLIHISTDYVFSHSQGRGPWREDDKTKTACEYGRTKLCGEEFVYKSGCRHLIIRASWIFGRYGSNFVKTMLRLGQSRSEVKVVDDQKGNPTSALALAEDIVSKILPVFVSDDFNDDGIYHYAGMESTTWDEFARAIFKLALEDGLIPAEVAVKSIPSYEYPSKVERPADSSLDCTKICERFDLTMPKWIDYLPGVLHSAYEELTEGQHA